MFTAAVAGSCIAFLCFNVHPAKVFMGDTGAFALGAALTAMGIATGMQLSCPLWVLCLCCRQFRLSFRSGPSSCAGRVFRMAPLHHHFELGGASENAGRNRLYDCDDTFVYWRVSDVLLLVLSVLQGGILWTTKIKSTGHRNGEKRRFLCRASVQAWRRCDDL